MATEQFGNFGETTLNGAVAAGATSHQFASIASMPATPFRYSIDDEIFLATALISGTTYSVVPGYEGSAQAAHANGAAVSHDVTAQIMQAVYPTGRVFSGSGTLVLSTLDSIINLNLSGAVAVSLPDSPIPFKPYTLNDKAGNLATNAATVTDPNGYLIRGASSFLMNVNSMTAAFIFDPSDNTWSNI